MNPPAVVSQALPEFGSATKRHAMRDSDSNQVVRRLNALTNLRVVKGLKNELLVGTTESVLSLRGLTDEADPESGGTIIVCEITAVNDSYLTCTNNATSETVQVAMPFELRTLPSDGPEIYPEYTVGENIVALFVDGESGVGSAPDWIDANVDARRWARALDLCNDEYALFHCSEVRPIV